MEITLNNTSAEEAKKAMAKNVAELEKKYVDQFGQEFMSQYKEDTSEVAGYLIEGIKEARKRLRKPDVLFTAFTIEFWGQARAVVVGRKVEGGSISFKVFSNEENIPTYCCDLFNAIFQYEAVDLAFGVLIGDNANIELNILKKEYNDINKFFKELSEFMTNNVGDNFEINTFGKKTA